MLSCGVPASDSPVSGLVPERTVPLVKAALPKKVSTPGLVRTGRSRSASTPWMRTSLKLIACETGPDGVVATISVEMKPSYALWK